MIESLMSLIVDLWNGPEIFSGYQQANPLAWAIPAFLTTMGFIGSSSAAKKQSRAARKTAQQAREDYYKYLQLISSLNEQKMFGAGQIMEILGGLAGAGDIEIPEEWLAEAQKIKRPSGKAIRDEGMQNLAAMEDALQERLDRQLAGFDDLPSGTRLQLQRDAQDAITQQRGVTGAQIARDVQQQTTAIDSQNVSNALQAAMANLQARGQALTAGRSATMSAIASGLGPLASMLTPIVPQQMGEQGYFQGPVDPGPLSHLTNSAMNAFALNSMFNFGGGWGWNNTGYNLGGSTNWSSGLPQHILDVPLG